MSVGYCGRCGCQIHHGPCPRHPGETPMQGGCPEGIPTDVFLCQLLSDQNELLRRQNGMLQFLVQVARGAVDQAQIAAAAGQIDAAAARQKPPSGLIITG